jgi:hypothetical protein
MPGRSWIRDQQIMTHLSKAFGSSQLAEIGVFQIERYKLDRLKAVSPATVNREIALLKHMFNLAEHWECSSERIP